MTERVRLERNGHFVELEQRSGVIVHTHGRIDSPPKSRDETHANAQEASAALAAHVRRMERKGFRVGFHHAELEAAILADPHDASARLVFADWLLERHDPRGELITRMAAGVDFGDHLAAFPHHLAPPWMTPCEVEWYLGFARKVTVRDGSLLPRLLRHPSFMVLEEMRLTGIDYVHVESFRQALSRRPSSLRRIDARGVRSLEPLASEIPGFEA